MTIDGMKVHSACVDKMDPMSAYVELHNLENLELTSGSGDLRYGSNLGGALAFRTKQPTAGMPTAGAVDLGYDVNSALRQVRGQFESSVDDFSLQATYTYRAADDYTAGGGEVVELSRFEKHNASLNATYLVAEDNTLSLQGILDIAPFIGYPGLIMDTRDARGYVGALTWKGRWSSSFKSSVKAYANLVDHTMDDYSRSIEEVANRDFMADMYMPMYGRSQTVGLLAEGQTILGQGILGTTLDLSHLSARADMVMEPLDTTVRDMRLTNIGDAQIGTYGLNLSYETMLDESFSLRFTGRGDISPRTLADESSRDILNAYVPNAPIDRTMFAGSVTAGFTYQITDELQSSVSVSTLERLPTHLESYGFWLYDPQSNFVTVGNPGLASERAWGGEAHMSWSGTDAQFRVNLYAQSIDRYIATVPLEDQTPVFGNNPPLRMYSNIGSAVLAGGEFTFNATLMNNVVIGGMAAYTYGQALDANDALPMITPLSGMLRVLLGDASLNLEMRARGALAQNRVSTSIQPEDATAGWVTLDAIGSWQVIEHLSIVVSALNLADIRYHEHTSINNISAKGRSLMVTVRSQW